MKEIKGTQTAKEEIKLPEFVKDIIIYVENPKKSMKTLLKLL